MEALVFDISFSKASTKFCLSLHYNGDNSYLFVNGKEMTQNLWQNLFNDKE